MVQPNSAIVPGSPYLAYPYSVSPLPNDLKKGLIAPGTTGIISAASCIVMLLFVVYRFLTWRSHFKTYIGYNQYVVLIVNLLIADMMQGVSFMFSFHWISRDGIFAPSKTCFAQGFLLNLGDLASGFFVFGIALHTFFGAVRARHAPHVMFSVAVISAWLFALLLSALGPMMHRDDYFVRAGAWCWASPKYETERLALHYFWIFLIQLGIVVLYALVFLHLKRTMHQILPSTQSRTHNKVDRAAKLMVLFPIFYIILTLPLSIGRMWSRAHGSTGLPTNFALAAGSMIGSSGMVDCLLYTLTRRALLRQDYGSSESIESICDDIEKRESRWRMSDFVRRGMGITQTRTVTITGDRLSKLTRDDVSSIHSFGRPSTSSTLRDKHDYLTNTSPYMVSPLSSQEMLATLGMNGLDPRMALTTVEITATANTPVMSERASNDGRGPSTEEMSRTGLVNDPYSVRAAIGLGLFRGPSTRS